MNVMCCECYVTFKADDAVYLADGSFLHRSCYEIIKLLRLAHGLPPLELGVKGK